MSTILTQPTSGAPTARPALAAARQPLGLALCGLSLGLAGVVLAAAARHPLTDPGAIHGGPFWRLPFFTSLAVGGLGACVLAARTALARAVALLALGMAMIGALALVEPLGVFHDSWQNVGLGYLALQPGGSAAAWSVPYVASAPVSYLGFGGLRALLPDTPTVLRLYPLACAALYPAGIAALALALADAHPGLVRQRGRLAAGAGLAVLALGPLMWIRVNPSPQSLAFLILPFALSALLRVGRGPAWRMAALGLFALIVFTHPITALMEVLIGAAWLAVDLLGRAARRLAIRRPGGRLAKLGGALAGAPAAGQNTLALYTAIFLTWLVTVGVWAVRSGDALARRVGDALEGGRPAAVTTGAGEQLAGFIWVHRAATVGAALLILAGLALMLRRSPRAGLRVLAWLGAAALWLPALAFGEFADRGPLFALPAAALAAGYLLAEAGPRWRPAAGLLAVLVTAGSFATAYPNHVGEAVAPGELAAFARVVASTADERIAYGYVPVLDGPDVALYASGRVRAFAAGAADFSYGRMAASAEVVVISEQMRASAALRGPSALAALDTFEADLARTHDTLYNSGGVRAYRRR